MKNKIIEAIDANKEAIYACGEYILNNPELGFKEYKTSRIYQFFNRIFYCEIGRMCYNVKTMFKPGKEYMANGLFA